MSYYFLVSVLPEIRRDDAKLKLRLGGLLEEREHLAAVDRRDVDLVLLRRDLALIEKLLAGREAEVEHALHGPDFWKDEIRSPRDTPAFLEDFLLDVRETGWGPRQADRLYGAYCDHVVREAASPLLRDYVRFERDLRNVLAAIRARRLGLPPADHLEAGGGDLVERIGRSVADHLGASGGDLVEQLGRSAAEDFGLGRDMPWLAGLLEAREPLEQDAAVEGVLWDYLEERVENRHFEFDVVLSYLLRLELLERRLALDEGQGSQIVRELEAL
jgi:hypothetical protein